MPAIDVVQLVRAALERNREIPAVLDAYSQFLDSPIGPIELRNLSEVFDRIQDNLSQRFPEIAARRAGTAARNDIASFLSAANGDPDRLKQLLRNELLAYRDTMVVSIAERFSKMGIEERRTIDGTLRLIYRSPFEILFRADVGKQLSSGGPDFERFFALVKSQSPTIKELRYENLIVEKAIFNKRILKAENRNYFVWIPSFFAKEGASALIKRLGLSNEHIMLSRLRELAAQSRIEQFDGFLSTLTDNLGVLGKNERVPEEFSDLVKQVGNYQVIPPVDLDDVFAFLQEESEKREEARLGEEAKLRLEEENRQEEQTRKTEQFRQKFRPTAEQKPLRQTAETQQSTGGDSVLLGKQLDFDQLVSVINRRVQEKDIPSQVRVIGDYFLQLPDFRKNIAIVGASGSGRSTTLRRLVDGLATKVGNRKIIIIDQKGEHRGLAWKYGWKVYSFAGDSQAQEFQVSFLPSSDVESKASLGADLIQEWFNQGSLNCTDQQRERVASIIRAHSTEPLTISTIADLMSGEPDLSALAQKLKKGLVSKSTFARIFSQTSTLWNLDQCTIFDISGRGLKDPTTREERQIISAILLRELALNPAVRDSIIVLEDALDRFKSESLRAEIVGVVQKNLVASGNSVIATARSAVKDFLGENEIQLLHRLSGEKVVQDELATFESDVPTLTIQRIVALLPRGYLITSKYTIGASSIRTAAVRVEPLTFS